MRKGMITMGLKTSSYWFSWFLTSLFYVLLSTAITVGVGNLVQMRYFLDCQFGINFVIIATFSMSLQFFGYFLTTIIATVKSGNSVTYALFLFGLFIQSLLGNVNTI